VFSLELVQPAERVAKGEPFRIAGENATHKWVQSIIEHFLTESAASKLSYAFLMRRISRADERFGKQA